MYYFTQFLILFAASASLAATDEIEDRYDTQDHCRRLGQDRSSGGAHFWEDHDSINVELNSAQDGFIYDCIRRGISIFARRLEFSCPKGYYAYHLNENHGYCLKIPEQKKESIVKTVPDDSPQQEKNPSQGQIRCYLSSIKVHSVAD